MKLLAKIQQELKAPKSQWNAFSKYNYRSCEDILGSVKPLLGDATLTVTDTMIQLGERYYIKATATIQLDDEKVSVDGWAREELNLKGQIAAQITGGTSSYARKYALNGLFAIDDTKDGDATNEGQYEEAQGKQKSESDDKPWFNDFDKMKGKFSASILAGERTTDQIISNLREVYKLSRQTTADIEGLANLDLDKDHDINDSPGQGSPPY